jgi:hypothetical protein
MESNLNSNLNSYFDGDIKAPGTGDAEHLTCLLLEAFQLRQASDLPR